MKRRLVAIAVASVLALGLLFWLLIWAGDPPAEEPIGVKAQQPTPTPAPEQRITLLFAGSDGLLHPELRSVPMPAEMEERVRIVLRELIAGSQKGFGPVVPYPAEVLGVYVDRFNFVFADLSPPPEPLAGSHSELLFAYGVANSVLVNCFELKGVQLLFAGEEVTSLSGHLDLSRPLALNRGFIAGQ